MKHELFVCECGDIEHQFVISVSDDDYNEVYLSVNLVTENFWKRLWYGIKYILGRKSCFGCFDEIIISPKDADRLQKVVDELRKCKLA